MIDIQILVMLGGFAVTLAVFFFTRVKEAENRGRLMQRVDELEKTIAEIRGRTTTIEDDVACHDTDLSKVTTEINGIKDMIKSIDKKLDRLIERRQTARDE
jgi:septal ring factor EnvC (AmiA/AmiB activator)